MFTYAAILTRSVSPPVFYLFELLLSAAKSELPSGNVWNVHIL